LTLDLGKQLNTAQLDAVGGAGNPQSADALAIDLDHLRAVGAVAADLLRRPLSKAIPPSQLIEVVRNAALSSCGLEDNVGKEPDIFGSGLPYVVAEHRAMLSLLIADRLADFGGQTPDAHFAPGQPA
jgi:hypothetical protein